MSNYVAEIMEIKGESVLVKVIGEEVVKFLPLMFYSRLGIIVKGGQVNICYWSEGNCLPEPKVGDRVLMSLSGAWALLPEEVKVSVQ